tara:strand:+ start:524 stop:808 length:285 start_codon:yes stop_codon:yes gene_type:complete
MIAAIITTIALLVASILLNLNQMRKQEKLEEYIEELENSNTNYYAFYNDLKKISNESYSRMRQIDRLGSFEADDEIGFIFKDIKLIIEELNRKF